MDLEPHFRWSEMSSSFFLIGTFRPVIDPIASPRCWLGRLLNSYSCISVSNLENIGLVFNILAEYELCPIRRIITFAYTRAHRRWDPNCPPLFLGSLSVLEDFSSPVHWTLSAILLPLLEVLILHSCYNICFRWLTSSLPKATTKSKGLLIPIRVG